MDPGRFSTAVCLVMVCVLGATRLSTAENCPCPKIPEMKLTSPPPVDCFQLNGRFRYTCIEGYKRKAGTSNLIKCEEKDGVLQWTASQLQCIRDPELPPSLPPQITNVSEITTKAPIWPETFPTYQSGSMSNSEATSSDDTEQSASGTKSMTTVHFRPALSSTHLTSNQNNRSRSSTEEHTADPKAVGISLSAVILLFAIGGLVFLLYRRKRRSVPTQEAEEMQPMNKPV